MFLFVTGSARWPLMEDQMGEAIDTHQAAARTGLAPGTMRKLRIRGEGPRFLKLGRAVRYRAADLDEWLSGRVVNSTSQRPAA